MVFADGTICAINENGEQRDVAIKDAHISSRLGNVPRVITFADGVSVVADDNDFIDAMLSRVSSLHAVESKWHWVLITGCAAVILATMTVIYGVPSAADVIARRLSTEHLSTVSTSVYETLKEGNFILPSNLSAAQTTRAEQIFARVADDYGNYNYRLRLHDFFVANAFALPDGLIIATDPMIELLSDDEMTAVFAHEIGHVEYRHGMRSVFESSGVLAFLILAGGDISGVVAGGVGLINLKYSRAHEREADCFAYHYLQQRNMSGVLLGSALHKMEEEELQSPFSAEESNDDNETLVDDEKIADKIFLLLSTHPQTEERQNLAIACDDKHTLLLKQPSL
ncbi:Zn-dependent protease with chaperone function [uncultured Candidatus Thioglobus sp.]|nr:Zn-dependent protease with chaperone function [uncultured Candidatus Thioglobus sp.]